VPAAASVLSSQHCVHCVGWSRPLAFGPGMRNENSSVGPQAVQQRVDVLHRRVLHQQTRLKLSVRGCIDSAAASAPARLHVRFLPLALSQSRLVRVSIRMTVCAAARPTDSCRALAQELESAVQTRQLRPSPSRSSATRELDAESAQHLRELVEQNFAEGSGSRPRTTPAFPSHTRAHAVGGCELAHLRLFAPRSLPRMLRARSSRAEGAAGSPWHNAVVLCSDMRAAQGGE
jgi:hypothetical protein